MVKREEFMFDSRDGQTKIHAVRWVPEGKVVGILQVVHGMAEYMERYENLAQYFGKKGILVTGEDHLGHGKSVPEGGLYGYFCEQDPATVVVRDVHRLKKMTQEDYPGIPYFILGHSMGSFIFRNYLLRYGSGIQGGIISGTGSQPGFVLAISKMLAAIQGALMGQGHTAKMLDKLAFGAYNKKISEAKTNFDWLCTDENVVNTYIKDPLCGFTFTINGFRTMFTLLERLNRRNCLRAMPSELPVHFMAGEQDPVGNYTKAVKAVYQSFKQAGMQRVSMKLYPNCRHEVLNEPIKYEVYEELYLWIMERVREYGWQEEKGMALQ